MWDFMKKNRPLKPVCQMQPTEDIIADLEKYRRYILESMDCTYKRILKELSVTDPETLTKLESVLAEYKEVETIINEKIKTIQTQFSAFSESYAPPNLLEVYDPSDESFYIALESPEGGVG